PLSIDSDRAGYAYHRYPGLERRVLLRLMIGPGRGRKPEPRLYVSPWRPWAPPVPRRNERHDRCRIPIGRSSCRASIPSGSGFLLEDPSDGGYRVACRSCAERLYPGITDAVARAAERARVYEETQARRGREESPAVASAVLTDMNGGIILDERAAA